MNTNTGADEEPDGHMSAPAMSVAPALSLTPTPVTDLCDLVDCAWAATPLAGRLRAGMAQAPLAALGFRSIGDLCALSPLTLLTLARAVSPRHGSLDGVWREALAAAESVVAPALEAALGRLLEQAFSAPMLRTAEQAAAVAAALSEAPYSALVFEPDAVIGACLNQQPPQDVYDIWTPSGMRQVDANTYSPQVAPLLSAAARTALVAAGCNLNLPLAALLWHSVRTLNACAPEGDSTLLDLARQTPEALFARRNVGPVAYREVIATVRAYLLPWLASLSMQALMGEGLATSHQPNQAPPDRNSAAEVEESPETLASLPMALRESDLLTVLDLYEVPWRDLFVGTLAPSSGPCASLVSDGAVPATAQIGRPANSSALAQANQLLADLAPLLAAHGGDWALADLTMREVMDAPTSATALPRLSTQQLNSSLSEIVHSLTSRLLHQVLCPAAFREGHADALAALRHVTIANLLTELFETRGGPGRRFQPHMVAILYDRNGLIDGLPRTLGSLGEHLNVTRERVRQLEKRAYEDLEYPSRQPMTHALGDLIRLAVEACGGVATLARAAARLGAAIPFGALDPECVTRFLARWCPDVTITSDALLIAQPYTEPLVRQTQQALREALHAHLSMTRDDLITAASAALGETPGPAARAFIATVLETMDNVTCLGGEYHLSGPGTTKSRVVKAMRSLGRPALVAEIAAEYRRLHLDENMRRDNSIRAFFDRFPETFVLVGNSTYALSEWGYDPRIRSIPTLVEHILEQSDRPLHYEEVTTRALERYRWKSIGAQLSTNPRITSFGNGFFGLRERDYGAFDSSDAYANLFGMENTPKDWLVMGTYTNADGHTVVRLRLSPACLGGTIQLSNKPLRQLFPAAGLFRAQVCGAGGATTELTLICTTHDVSGLRLLFGVTNTCAGDALFIERLASDQQSDAPIYRVAVAPASDLAGAMRAVRLGGALASDASAGDLTALHYARKPHKITLLLERAVECPWMSLQEVNPALNCVSNSPAGAEYLWLAQATGMVATGRPTPWDALTVRPTALGRAWAFSPGTAAQHGRWLALSFPAYRAHLRSLGASGKFGSDSDGEMHRISPRVSASWDRLCSVTVSQDASAALEQRAAYVSSDLLVGPALPLLLLLLVAQTQGRGLACSAIDAALGGRTDEALRRLRALGLALAENDLGHIALAERVTLALVAPLQVEQALAADEATAATALALAWRGALAGIPAQRALRMSDLYSALQMCAPDLLAEALVTPPAAAPESARYVDAEAPFCGFPALAADWALADPELPSATTPPLETLISYTCRDDRPPSLAPIGVALCDDLLTQPWEVERHLAGNAHLALLTVIVADEGNLAERLRRSDAGWLLDGAPLVSALDALLRSLGYDPWDERYRGDAERKLHLGQELVALAERLHLMGMESGHLEAIGGLATRVYYDACDRSFTDRVTAALRAAPVFA